MMIETKTTLEPQDLIGIEFECSVCRATQTRKLAEYRAAPFGCTNCNAQWEFQTEDMKSLGVLLAMLKRFADRQTAKGVPFTVRFEIAGKVQP